MDDEKQTKTAEADQPDSDGGKGTGKKSSSAAEHKKKIAALEAEKAELLESLEKAQTELAAAKDSHLRTLAEYDNYRRRTTKEKQDLYVSSKADVVAALLPVLDNLVRASQAQGDPDSYRQGIELTVAGIDKALESLGVESFGEVGDKFDPNIHEALMRMPAPDKEDDTVALVISKGYRTGDRIIRHAQVGVVNNG